MSFVAYCMLIIMAIAQLILTMWASGSVPQHPVISCVAGFSTLVVAAILMEAIAHE